MNAKIGMSYGIQNKQNEVRNKVRHCEDNVG